jgi:hypothetical protein
MHSKNSTMVSGNPDTSSAAERGFDGPWSLLETLDSYEVEELTPAQAAELLRATAAAGKARPPAR